MLFSVCTIIYRLSLLPCTSIKINAEIKLWNLIYVHIGSALNVFSKEQNKTNAFLVYGFSDSKVRVWVDSSENGGKTYIMIICDYDKV